MPRQAPGVGPDDEHATSPAGAGFPFAERFPPPAGPRRPAPSADDRVPSARGASAGRPVWPDGLDYQALLDGLAAGGYLDGRLEDQDAILAEEIAAAEEGRMLPVDSTWVAAVAALAAQHMEPGPAQAGWLEVAAAEAGNLDENALTGMAVAAEKLVSRGQALGLTAAAQITARAATADPRIGVAADGRPARLCQDGLKQIMVWPGNVTLLLPVITSWNAWW